MAISIIFHLTIAFICAKGTENLNSQKELWGWKLNNMREKTGVEYTRGTREGDDKIGGKEG